jgi:hypothetical protein
MAVHKYKENQIVWHKDYGRGVVTTLKEWPHYHFLPDLKYIRITAGLSVSAESVGLMDVSEDTLSGSYQKAKYVPEEQEKLDQVARAKTLRLKI